MKESGLEGYEYFAFISYSSKDKKFAEKLQKHLESYRLPALLGRQYPRTPRKIQPVFRDRTDLEQGNLKEMLKRALSTSKFLLVICTENSAQPNAHGKRYVDLEVNEFVALNPDVNKARVIPIIYREKDGARATACLPPAVKDLDILAIDVLDKGYNQAFNQVVSRMIGIKPGILWDRWRRKSRQQGILYAFLAVFLMVLIAGSSGVSLLFSLLSAIIFVSLGSFIIWRHLTPRVVNYEHFIEINNLPVGIHKLTDAEVAQRHRHYRFTYHKGRLRKVECCNSSGVPVKQDNVTHTHPEVSCVEIFYNEKGHVNRHLWSDAHGKKLRDIEFEKNNAIDWMRFLSPGGDFSASHRIEKSGNHSTVTRYRLKRNEQGQVISVSYCNDAGLLCADCDGTWGYSYELTEAGQIAAIHYLNDKGERMRNRDNIAGRIFKYNTNGHLLEYANIDEKGSTVYDQNSVALVKYSVDEYGNFIEISHYGINDELVMGTMQVAKKRVSYDERGFVVSESYYDLNGSLCLNKEGFARCNYVRNSAGTITEIAFYGVDEKSCYCRNSYHREIRTVDEFGNCCTATYFDIHDKPCLNVERIHRKEHKYNSEGYVQSVRYYDINDTPCYHKGGYHMVCLDYNQTGNIASESYFDTNAQPCYNSEGVASINREYDAYSNCVTESYMDTDGKPCFLPEKHVSVIKREYDNQQNLICELYLGANGKPCADYDGIHKCEWSYNDRGWVQSLTYRSIDGDIWWDGDGVSKQTMEYDETGKLVSKTFFSFERQNLISKYTENYEYDDLGRCRTILYKAASKVMGMSDFDVEHVTCFEYDSLGNMVKQRFCNSKGEPLPNNSGVYEKRYCYDEHNRRTVESTHWLDSGDESCCHEPARIEWSYDEKGYIVSISHYGVNGKPCLNKEGYAFCSIKRSEAGLPEETAYYGVDGTSELNKDYTVFSRQYNEKGSLIKCRYLSSDGSSSVDSVSGISFYEIDYNELNLRVRESYYDIEGKPCLNRISGAHSLELKYNSDWRIESISYKDPNSNPVLCNDGYSRLALYYNGYGNIRAEIYYGVDGKLCNSKHGYARRFVYRGRREKGTLGYKVVPPQTISMEKFYNASGVLCMQTDEFKMKATSSQCNKQYVLKNMSFSSSELLVPYTPISTHGYAYRLRLFDEDGNITQEEERDEYAKLVADSCKHSKRMIRYEFGSKVEESYYGADEKPCKGMVVGYSRMVINRNQDGKPISEILYDVNNQVSQDNCFKYARKVYQYDCTGKIKSEEYYDRDGHLCMCHRGFARMLYLYNEDEKVVCVEFQDVDGAPCNNSDGYARVVYMYDDKLNLLCKELRDLDNGLCNNIRVASRVVYSYNENNKLVKTEEYNCLGQLKTPVVIRKYDKVGNCTHIEQYDAQGAPFCPLKGFHRLLNSYDNNGKLLSKETFGIDGKLLVNEFAYAKIEYRYDEKGNLVSKASYDALGRPCINTVFKAHKMLLKYDDCNNLTNVEYRECNGYIWMGYNDEENYAVARSSFEYDNMQRLVKEQHYDTQGKLFCITDKTGKKTGKRGLKYACVEYKYIKDVLDVEVKQARYFDENGNEIV